MFVTYINRINVSQISAMVEITSAFSVSTVAAVVCNDAMYIGLLCSCMKTFSVIASTQVNGQLNITCLTCECLW